MTNTKQNNHELEKRINEIVRPVKYDCPAREDGLCFQRGTECPYSMKVEPSCEDRSLIFLHSQYTARLKQDVKKRRYV